MLRLFSPDRQSSASPGNWWRCSLPGFLLAEALLYVLCGSVVVLRQQKPAAPPRLLLRCCGDGRMKAGGLVVLLGLCHGVSSGETASQSVFWVTTVFGSWRHSGFYWPYISCVIGKRVWCASSNVANESTRGFITDLFRYLILYMRNDLALCSDPLYFWVRSDETKVKVTVSYDRYWRTFTSSSQPIHV